MTVEAELLAAIAAAPDDDAPRLVYADALMQRGDPRGEFIALQCRIARADAADQRIDEAVLARERELYEAHAATWSAPLRAIVDADYRFRRGFVEEVAVWVEHHIARSTPAEGDPDDDRLGDLLAEAPLLGSIKVHAKVLDHVLTPAWNRLHSVTLCETGGTSEAIGNFFASHAGSLRRLHLVNASTDDEIARRWLGTECRLDHLGFHIGWNTTRPDNLPVAELVDANPALHDLRSLYLGGIPRLDPRPLACLSRLERLSLHRCGVSIQQVLELLRTLPALEMLELDNDDRTLGPAIPLSDLLDAAPSLRRLAVRNWELGASGATSLANSPRASQLRRLELDGCNSGEGAALLSENLRDLVWLRVFDRSSNLHVADDRSCYEPPPPRYPRELVEQLPQNKIGSIKAYRELTHAYLSDAKMAIERIAEELGMGPAPGPAELQFLRATTRWCTA